MPKTLNKTVTMHREPGDPLSEKQKANLAALAANPKRDEEIDLSDAPEVPDDAVLQHFRPRKASITLRIDADVLAWLKAGGEGYQTRVNALLRRAMKGQ